MSGNNLTTSDAIAATLGALVSHWTEVAAAAAALVALVLSAKSNGTSRAALRLAQQQEQRRRPAVAPYLRAHRQERLPDAVTQYSFDITLGSQSDTDNAIVEAELHLNYRVDDAAVTAKIPQDPDHVTGDLVLPLKLGARDAMSGCCRFKVNDGVLNGAMVDLFAVVLVDTFGKAHRVEAQILRTP